VENEPPELESELESYSEYEQEDTNTYYLDQFLKIKQKLRQTPKQATSSQQRVTSNQKEQEGSEHRESLIQTVMTLGQYHKMRKMVFSSYVWRIIIQLFMQY
jgi:hypothetical protein